MLKIISYGVTGASKYTVDDSYVYSDCELTYSELRSRVEDCKDEDIIGILTYGSYFVRNEQPLTASYVERIMESYDLILPDDAGNHIVSGAFISRAEILRSFLRSVSAEIDQDVIDTSSFAELLREYVISHSLKVKTETLIRKDPEIWNNGYRLIESLQNYMDALLNDYINLRQNAGFEDSFADEEPYQGDFGGKVPVWICWWQGLEDAPDLIKACVRSVERNLPVCAELKLITFDNLDEYATLTQNIRAKYDSGKISLTHLSDILRAELLYRYGGMWIDATYFVSHPISEEFLRQDLFSIAFNPPLWGMDIQQGRWTLSLIVACRHHPAMQFLMEGLWLYWEMADQLIDYFTVDYVCDAGYRHIDRIREAFDSIPPSSPAVYDLQLMMNQRISDRGESWLERASGFYKLNRRNVYAEYSEHGFLTYYGHILRTGYEECSSHIGNADNTPGSTKIRCDSEVELIRLIRETDPDRIIDMDGYYASTGCISRGILDDIILHDLRIDAIQKDDMSGISACPVYDGRVTDLPDKHILDVTIEDKYRMIFC